MELPILLVNDGVLLPNTQMKVPIRSKSNFTMIETCLLGKNPFTMIALAYRADRNRSEHANGKVFNMCTMARVEQIVCWSTYSTTAQYTLHLKGIARGEIAKFGSPLSEVKQLYDTETNLDEAMLKEFDENLPTLISLASGSMNRDALKRLIASNEKQYDKMVDLSMAILRNVTYEDQLSFLAECNLSKRMLSANEYMKEAFKAYDNAPNTTMPLQFLKELDVRSSNGKSNNEFVRRLPLQQHQNGAKKPRLNELDQLAKDLELAQLPVGTVHDQAMEEMERLRQLSPASQDYQVMHAYLKLVANLPWNRTTEDRCDLQKSKDILNSEHEGMGEVKKRILEFLAVKQLKQKMNGPILCLVGPPGVGKTSIAKSVAETLGRNFQRIALGGLRDQSNIRGHRRTYVGAMPGRIIQSMKLAKTKNPVILLDEVDKLGVGPQGDPSAALLEVLDPAQNHTFQDLYLNLPFDLSQVVFIATANDKSTIPAPLLDRMEILEMPSYSSQQKFEIAKRHILPRQLTEHALSPDYLQLQPDAIHTIIDSYTREAGVRQLERTIGAVCRWAAVEVAQAINGGQVETDTMSSELILPIVVRASDLTQILGKEKYSRSRALLKHASLNPGVSLGLAWTPFGGEVLVIETLLSEGTGKLVLTGKLGDVIKESVQVAVSWLRSKANIYNLDFSEFKNSDLHVHLPAGAVAKDGPSAGCAFTLALFSLISGRKVRSDSACTGEVTLTGKVLPVGGIKEKVLAAHRSGINRVILPLENKKDVDDLDAHVLEQMHIDFVDQLEDLIEKMMDPLESEKISAKL